MDLAKAVALAVTHEGDLLEYTANAESGNAISCERFRTAATKMPGGT